MQMNLIETNLAQRGSLPLPSAALVIDMRGTDEDDIMDRLRIEIADLAEEMKVHDLNHWRFLTEFLSFRSIPPLRIEDVNAISSQRLQSTQQNIHDNQQAAQAKVSQKTEHRGLTGQVASANNTAFFSPFQDDQGSLINEPGLFDIFQQRIEEITLEVDRIRNNRIAAVADLNKAGVAGRSIMDATVRVIFLTNANHHGSLSSVSAYATHLKKHFKKLERDGYQPMISVTVVCLDNSSDAGPPIDLIQGLSAGRDNEDRWGHIDSLILSEKYSDNAALIAGTMQTYLAELLLYVLLIIPPLRINSFPAEINTFPLLESNHGEHQPKGQWVTLPTHSYLVGLAAVEHSARWGRRWLNYGLVADGVEILQNRIADDDLERRRIKNIVEAWLSDWRAQVAGAIPGRIPGNINALQAIPNAISTASPPEETFTTHRFNFGIGKMTLLDLENYLTAVKRTYVIPLSERAELRQDAAISYEVVLDPTLQDAIDSIPLIQQRMREWEDRDPALKKGTPLVNAQLEAQRILTNPSFFTGVNGAVPRARMQLKELGTAISDFQNAHQRTDLDLMDKRTKLEKRGQTLITELEKHVNRIPFLGAIPHLNRFMAWLTFVLIFFSLLLAALLGFAWLEHLIVSKASAPGFLPIMNTALRLDESPLAFVIWGSIAVLILLGLFIFRSTLFDKDRSAWEVEIIFWFMLIVTALSGLLFHFSVDRLQSANDMDSLALLSWLAPLTYISGTIALVAFIILLVEAAWFWRWINHLMQERAAIVNDLRDQHRSDVNAVTRYIADTVALQLLQRTGLTDGKGSPGRYYDRMDQLNKRLVEVLYEATFQRELAANRLALSLSDMQPGSASSSGTWLNLKIREERLDVESLTDGYQRLREHMSKEPEELTEFSQLLLCMMGEQAPIEIEQQFRAKPFTGNAEQRQAQVLMATLAALALRFSVAAPSVDSMTPIIERYENIDNHYVHQVPALNTLIQTLRKRVRKTTLQPILGAASAANNSQGLSINSDLARENITMAANGFAMWEQMLWEHKDRKLGETLVQDGVLPKLLNDGYDPKAVMRHLQARTSLFGRSMPLGQQGDVFLLLSPSVQSRMFRQSLNISSRLIIDFPDVERLLLLYIQRFMAEPLFIPESRLSTPEADQTMGQSSSDAQQGISEPTPIIASTDQGDDQALTDSATNVQKENQLNNPATTKPSPIIVEADNTK